METTRRQFLEVVAIAAAGVGTACGDDSPAEPERLGAVDAGNVDDIPVGTLHAIDFDPVCIGRDDRGLYAMTLTCTHRGCNIADGGTVSPGGIRCDCHGARFDANGDVVSGPARGPLAHFPVTVDEHGNVTIDTDSDAAPDERVAV